MGKIPLKNWAISIAIKRLFRIQAEPKPITWKEFYTNIPNDYSGILKYAKEKSEKRKKNIDAVLKNISANGRILEAGCGTSVLSIWLSSKGHNCHSLDIDLGMLDLAKKLNATAKTSVKYKQGDLFHIPYPMNFFDVIFSHGVLEHFKITNIPEAINEGLRVAKTYIFSIPAIFDVSNNLRGDEHLLTYWHWVNIVKKTKGYIVNTYGSFPYHPKLEKLNNRLNEKLRFFAPVLILEIKRKTND